MRQNYIDPQHIVREFFRYLWGKIKFYFKNYLLYYISFVVSNIGTILIRVGNFDNLNIWQWLGVTLIPLPLTFITIQNKKNEKQLVRTELDFQYAIALKFAGKAVYDLQNVVNSKTLDNHQYLKQLLAYLAFSVDSILLENRIPSGNLSANIMIPDGQKLKILAFGLDLPNRKYISLPLDDKNIIPGGPAAFFSNKIDYINDTKSKKYKKYFSNPEYRSFFSIPIQEDDNDGPVFCVINIDSDLENQFKGFKFISEKIYPALSPLISLIKILHKINKM